MEMVIGDRPNGKRAHLNNNMHYALLFNELVKTCTSKWSEEVRDSISMV